MSIRISRSAFAFVGLIVVVGILLLVPVVSQLREQQRYYRFQREIRSMIDALADHPPAETEPERWRRAVEWTSNVIAQDFFAPTPKELVGVEQLAKDFRRVIRQQVDYETLQWVWDHCEEYCGGPESCAIRFRDIPLLSRDLITDQTLRNAWSIDRCQGIDLSGTPVTNASIALLKTKPNLRWIVLSGTKVTRSGVEELQAACPAIEVTWP